VKLKGAPEGAHLLVCGPTDPISPEEQKELDEWGIRLHGTCFAAVSARNGEAIDFSALPIGPLGRHGRGRPPSWRNRDRQCKRRPRAGREARRVDRMPTTRTAAPGPVSGTIEIQGEWRSSAFSLRLYRCDRPAPRSKTSPR